MELSIATINNITFVKPIGNMLNETDLHEATKTLSGLIDQGQKYFVFDLSQVNFFNSIGLSWLIGTLTKSRRHDGDTVLMNIPEQLEKLLIITKLHAIFHTLTNGESAETYFNKLH